MQCSIGAYYLADGTLAGGYALSNLRIKIQRIFDIAIPIGAVSPVFFDRGKRKVDITFSVVRVQDTITDAENFCNIHEATVPRTGDIQLITTAPVVSLGLILNGELLSHELIKQIGKYTEHAYHIVGAKIFAATPGVDELVTEAGDHITTEGGDRIGVE
jgi:hypothetical protein